MTYPPYDPNSGYGQPDPYGQQPQPYGGDPSSAPPQYQQPDYYQQPQQPPGQQQPGGYPGQASGPAYDTGYQQPGYQQQPDPAYQQPGYQQPDYGQQAGYQQPGYQQQPPGYPAGPPPGSGGGGKGPLIGALVGGGALVVVIIVVIFVVVALKGSNTPAAHDSASPEVSSSQDSTGSASPTPDASSTDSGTEYKAPGNLCDKTDYTSFKNAMGGGDSPASNNAGSGDPAIAVCTSDFGDYGKTDAMVSVTGIFEKSADKAQQMYTYYHDTDSKQNAKSGTTKDDSGLGGKSFQYQSSSASTDAGSAGLEFFVVDGNLLLHVSTTLTKSDGSWSASDLDKMYTMMKDTASGTLTKLKS